MISFEIFLCVTRTRERAQKLQKRAARTGFDWPDFLPDPEINLAAYGGIVFPLALIIESPIIMFLRISVSMPPTWQIGLSIALSLTSLYLFVWLSARIYRVGILMYGKRPSLAELRKWLRYA